MSHARTFYCYLSIVKGMDFLYNSKFQYHGCLTSHSCMITGKWELKIADYGLTRTRIATLDPLTLSSLRKNYLPLHDSSNTIQPRIVDSYEKLLWLAPETVTILPFDTCVAMPTKRSDVYR